MKFSWNKLFYTFIILVAQIPVFHILNISNTIFFTAYLYVVYAFLIGPLIYPFVLAYFKFKQGSRSTGFSLCAVGLVLPGIGILILLAAVVFNAKDCEVSVT